MGINQTYKNWECGTMCDKTEWFLNLPLFRMGCPGDEHEVINLPECRQSIPQEMNYNWFASIGKLLKSEPFCFYQFCWYSFRKNCLEPNRNYFKQEFGWDDHKVETFLEDGIVFLTARDEYEEEYEEGEEEYLEEEGRKLPTLKNFWEAVRNEQGHYGLEY